MNYTYEILLSNVVDFIKPLCSYLMLSELFNADL